MNGIVLSLCVRLRCRGGSQDATQTTTHYATSTVKTALILVFTGTLVGVAVASFVVPPMLSWDASPGGLPQGQIPAVVQIPEVIRYATSKLIWGQTIGGGMGAAIGLLISFLLRRKGHRGAIPPVANRPMSR